MNLFKLLVHWLRWAFQHHLYGSHFIVALTTLIIASQVSLRDDFANSEVAQDVEQRWGAPVAQSAPSLRFVQSGSIFTDLKPLSFDKQNILIDAEMNYRKRGLRYFSGFDFVFQGDFSAKNPENYDIDVAFIFPIEVNKSQVLLSELQFTVNNQKQLLDLGNAGNRLVWTGRIPRGESASFQIRYRARGLEVMTYALDPSLRADNVHIEFKVKGGENIDYPQGALSAQQVLHSEEGVTLLWDFPSLQSGVMVGAVLPSQKTYDTLISSMALRGNITFVALMGLLIALSIHHRRKFLFFESYLLAAAYGFSFVFLAYLAAFMNFYVAYLVTLFVFGGITCFYLLKIFPQERPWVFGLLWISTWLIPTFAVILEGYTGLIYTLELLVALFGLMRLSMNDSIRNLLSAPAIASGENTP